MPALTTVPAAATPDQVSARQPRSTRTCLAALFRSVPGTLDEAAAAVRLSPESFVPMPGGAWQADLAVPRGFWRLWPERGVAAWFGTRQDRPLDRPPAQLDPARLDLLNAVQRLRQHGHWPVEVSLLGTDGWTAAQPAYEALVALADGQEGWRAVAGTWSDGVGGAVYVELDRDGHAWAHERHDAERFLLLAAGLEDG